MIVAALVIVTNVMIWTYSRLDRVGCEPHVEIIVDRLHQQVELVREEVVRAGDQVVMDGDVPLRAQLVDELLDRARSDDLVGFALDDDAR